MVAVGPPVGPTEGAVNVNDPTVELAAALDQLRMDEVVEEVADKEENLATVVMQLGQQLMLNKKTGLESKKFIRYKILDKLDQLIGRIRDGELWKDLLWSFLEMVPVFTGVCFVMLYSSFEIKSSLPFVYCIAIIISTTHNCGGVVSQLGPDDMNQIYE